MAELLCALRNLVNFVGRLSITSLVARADWVTICIIAGRRRTGRALGVSLLAMLLLWGVLLVVLLLLLLLPFISALWGVLSVAALLMVLRRLLVISASVALIVGRLRVILARSRV